MRETKSISYIQYPCYSELPVLDRELVKRARAAAERSHSPYSNFAVGAAVRLSNGEVVSATNIESEVYPQGMCAERTLLYFVAANYGEHTIESLAVSSISSDSICYPCGACRQTMLDAERQQGSPIRILMAGSIDVTVVESAAHLLPFAFKLTTL